MTIGMGVCLARRRRCFPLATRRAIPTAEIAEKVNDVGGIDPAMALTTAPPPAPVRSSFAETMNVAGRA
jgi:hypothetical protein